MRIYLSARYERRLELCGYREQIEHRGHTVTSRWLKGAPAGIESLIESHDEDGAWYRIASAQEDMADIESSDLLIAFSEPPESDASRGGRHVEFGFALALNVPLWVVGPPENIFHWLTDVRVFPDVETALARLEVA